MSIICTATMLITGVPVSFVQFAHDVASCHCSTTGFCSRTTTQVPIIIQFIIVTCLACFGCMWQLNVEQACFATPFAPPVFCACSRFHSSFMRCLSASKSLARRAPAVNPSASSLAALPLSAIHSGFLEDDLCRSWGSGKPGGRFRSLSCD